MATRRIVPEVALFRAGGIDFLAFVGQPMMRFDNEGLTSFFKDRLSNHILWQMLAPYHYRDRSK
jgi:hypothetical protein